MKRAVAAAALVLLFLLAVRGLSEPPVLMYHRVNEPGNESEITVRPENFEKQMEFLKLHRYRVVPLETLVEALKRGKGVPSKTVAITFDDGTLDNIRHAFPVLRQMGFPATVFMITDNIGRPGWLSEEDLKVLDDGKVSIGSHTAHHAFLPELSPSEAERELTESKKRLESILGHEVTLFSYPAGGTTPQVEELVKKAGYAGAVTTNYASERRDPYAIRRIKIGDAGGNLFNFWAKTSGLYSLGKKRVRYRPGEPRPSYEAAEA